MDTQLIKASYLLPIFTCLLLQTAAARVVMKSGGDDDTTRKKKIGELMSNFGSNMVDKSAYVLSLLVSIPEARVAAVEEGGIPVLVELVEVGSQRNKELAADILLQICEDSVLHRALVVREGAAHLGGSGRGSTGFSWWKGIFRS